MTPLAIRADADAAIGAGHVMRTLAIAEAWHRACAGEVVWFTVAAPALVRTAASTRGVRIRESSSADESLDALLAWVRAHPDAWVVLDGYDFGIDTQRVLTGGGAHLLVLDDCAAGAEFACDILLNQNIGAETLEYHTPAHTRRLMGTRYALLRSEFTNEAVVRSFDQPASRIVVTFGGADAHNQAARVARILMSLAPPLHATVIAGQAHPHSDGTTHVAPQVQIDWRSAAVDMAKLLKGADLVVCAAGSTCWEVAHLGIPAITLTVSDNQERIGEELNAAGVVRSLGWFNRVSDEGLAGAIESLRRDPARVEMSRKGRALIDGHGADRVVAAMRERGRRDAVTLRRATMDDATRLFAWRTDEETIRHSTGPAPASFEAHRQWLEETLGNPRVTLYVAYDTCRNVPVGTVRLDRLNDHDTEVSLTVEPALRGRGYARELIERAAEAAGGVRLIAHVKASNEPSLRAFTAVGFKTEADGDLQRLVRP